MLGKEKEEDQEVVTGWGQTNPTCSLDSSRPSCRHCHCDPWRQLDLILCCSKSTVDIVNSRWDSVRDMLIFRLYVLLSPFYASRQYSSLYVIEISTCSAAVAAAVVDIAVLVTSLVMNVRCWAGARAGAAIVSHPHVKSSPPTLLYPLNYMHSMSNCMNSCMACKSHHTLEKSSFQAKRKDHTDSNGILVFYAHACTFFVHTHLFLISSASMIQELCVRVDCFGRLYSTSYFCLSSLDFIMQHSKFIFYGYAFAPPGRRSIY